MSGIVSQRRAADGVSLIELMIALAIGTVLLIGLVQVFAASRTAYQLSTGLARVQENGRFAMDILQRDLRMAGHVGCVNDQARFLPENVTVSRPAIASTFVTAEQLAAGNYALPKEKEPLRFDVGMEGFDAKVGGAGGATNGGSAITVNAVPALATGANSWAPAIPDALYAAMDAAGAGRPVINSDIVVLRYFNPVGVQMETFMPGTTATLTFRNGPRLLEGDSLPGLFGISDCLNSAVFQATSAVISATNNAALGTLTVTAMSGLNASGLLGAQSFVAGQATIYRAESVAYYIGLNGDNNPALYRVRFVATRGPAGNITAVRDEMVEGIETLQLQYGQDSRLADNERPTGNIGSSATANALLLPPSGDVATAWRRVGLVQVGIVARSPDTAAAQQRDTANGASPLTALGVTVTPATSDGRYRAVYGDSIAFRNRLFGN